MGCYSLTQLHNINTTMYKWKFASGHEYYHTTRDITSTLMIGEHPVLAETGKHAPGFLKQEYSLNKDALSGQVQIVI